GLGVPVDSLSAGWLEVPPGSRVVAGSLQLWIVLYRRDARRSALGAARSVVRDRRARTRPSRASIASGTTSGGGSGGTWVSGFGAVEQFRPAPPSREFEPAPAAPTASGARSGRAPPGRPCPAAPRRRRRSIGRRAGWD